ncbi:MAG: hypothetical protein E7168_01185 [Firmicutes bacterium]|nr:hypothetical protein [Bacillota bacterium]
MLKKEDNLKIDDISLDEIYNDYDDFVPDISEISDLITKNDYTQELNNIFDCINNEEVSCDSDTRKISTIEEINPNHSTVSFDEVQEDLKTQQEIREAFVKNAKTDRTLKIVYGVVLLVLLALQLIGVNVVFVFGGLGKLNYTDNTFNLFIAGSLIEIAVIVRIVVKYLFTDNISKPFDNVIKHHHDKKNNQK